MPGPPLLAALPEAGAAPQAEEGEACRDGGTASHLGAEGKGWEQVSLTTLPAL